MAPRPHILFSGFHGFLWKISLFEGIAGLQGLPDLLEAVLGLQEILEGGWDHGG